MASSTLLRTLVAPQPRSAVAKPVPVPVPVPLSFLHGNQRKVGLSLSAAQRRPSRRGSIVCQAQEAAAVEVPDVTSSTWQEQVLGSDMAVLVEFWAPWCGPCRMMHPIIGKLSKIYEGKLKCFKLNTDENQEVAAQYGIRSIPTILIFKNGEKKDAIIGAVSESALVTTIEKYVGN